MFAQIRTALRLIDPTAVRLRLGECPMCGATVFLKLQDTTGLAIRCVRCRGSTIAMSMVLVLKQAVPDLSTKRVYELSSRGTVYNYLKARAFQLSCSEYFDDVQPGQFKDGVQCQDVQKLMLEDCMFDLCTSTEVFEHVPDDGAGFQEICRVLKEGGTFVFTVPMTDAKTTVERARAHNGRIEHLLEPEYHGDRIRGDGRVLCFRNYGLDIVDRLTSAGFARATIVVPNDVTGWKHVRPVIVAQK